VFLLRACFLGDDPSRLLLDGGLDFDDPFDCLTQKGSPLTDAARIITGSFLQRERRYFTVRSIAIERFIELQTECIFGGNKNGEGFGLRNGN
jgi:hypothetical protein